ncbi:MAG: hypothetical protein H6828_01615 [Planctomycetes bacterium]|nr:hypothetical protein [Planctomycetota bacterium]
MRSAARLLPVPLLVLASACSSVEFQRTSESSGTFVATGNAVTLLGVDIPRSAMNQARENASDAGLHNMQVTETEIWPYLGWFDFLLEILSVRHATIRGTWGYESGS